MSVSEVISVVSAWLSPCWQLFLLPFPLFSNVSFADIYVGIALASIAILVIKRAIDSPEGEPFSSANRLHQSELRRSGKWFRK